METENNVDTKLATLGPLFRHYDFNGAYDEMFAADGLPRPPYQQLYQRIQQLAPAELHQRQLAADTSFLHQGITFTVYGSNEGTERIFPYDLLPRIISSSEWSVIERGLTQRIVALNLFLHDIYHEGRILAQGVVPHDCNEPKKLDTQTVNVTEQKQQQHGVAAARRLQTQQA